MKDAKCLQPRDAAQQVLLFEEELAAVRLMPEEIRRQAGGLDS